VDIRKVKKLIELLEESGIAEIEISEGDDSVRISRYPQGGMSAPVAIPMPAAAPPTPDAASIPEAQAAVAPVAPPAAGHEVTAPMVGTFYASATPGARPFVEIGSQVEAGDTLCIIEAMKMMNQIETDFAGRVVSIQVENGEPVEYGQVLFIIE
jgi:acetyl-CoA carboxylase biotin carboxyl carrier protein